MIVKSDEEIGSIQLRQAKFGYKDIDVQKEADRVFKMSKNKWRIEPVNDISTTSIPPENVGPSGNLQTQ